MVSFAPVCEAHAFPPPLQSLYQAMVPDTGRDTLSGMGSVGAWPLPHSEIEDEDPQSQYCVNEDFGAVCWNLGCRPR
eukprot:CAMPEP_0181347704 /NCGR_PEP_ID=MMETSP1101-20121128/34019_1 /TAXON_ID=46948 /ORGANISM="Rhodomonas abbreviata, Strain Caron Lab Isolate" /LENGTH=76 /DNA_ID=CAMNT_0023459933 /DNA_START=293 /DNA_END=521 /DNA_ORIENTATION=+